MASNAARLAAPVLLVLPILAAAYGGWASVTLEDLPDHAVARQALNLTFTVRQHGVEPMHGLSPRVEARRGSAVLGAPAEAAGKAGQYNAQLVLPDAGEWTITIYTGFWPKQVRLMPIAVIEPGAAAPRPMADADRGERLFVAKGCITCHVHREVPGSGVVDAGPDLTGRRFPADYLQRFLADPAAAKPGMERRMPNLELKQREIAALTAFINGEGTAVGVR